jgi:predicted protein tyrosine phosphatase
MIQLNTSTLKRTYDMHHDEIVIGCSLSALLYSYIRKVPFIYLETLKPSRFDKYEDMNAREIWDRLYITNSFIGLNLFTNTLGYIDVQDDKITVRTKTGEEYFITYNKAKVFDSWNLTGLEFKDANLSNIEYEVLDYFKVSLGRNLKNNIKQKSNTFVKEVRLCFLHSPTDYYYKRVMAISILNGEEVFDPNYNETCARIVTKRLMKKAKIQGRTSKQTKKMYKIDENGKKVVDHYTYPTYVRPIALFPHVRKIRRMNCFEVENTDKVTFMKETPLEIFTNYRMVLRSRFGEIIRMLYGRTNTRRTENWDEERIDEI